MENTSSFKDLKQINKLMNESDQIGPHVPEWTWNYEQGPHMAHGHGDGPHLNGFGPTLDV